MIKKTVEYVDFNNEKVIEDLYFHLSKDEMQMIELTYPSGGLSYQLQRAVESGDMGTFYITFRMLILKAFGQKTANGRSFMKDAQLTKEFEYSPAFIKIMDEFLNDMDKMEAFLKGVIPEFAENFDDAKAKSMEMYSDRFTSK